MKLDPHKALELSEKLRPFLEGRRNTCFSEIQGVLKDIMHYLEEGGSFSTQTVTDPTIRNQLDLPLEVPPKRGDTRFQLLDDYAQA